MIKKVSGTFTFGYATQEVVKIDAELIILNDGGPSPTRDASMGMFFKCDGTGVLIECGPKVPGALEQSGINPFDIKDLFFSHIDLDHTAGFENLMEYLFKNAAANRVRQELRLWGPNSVVEDLIGRARAMPIMRSRSSKRPRYLVIHAAKADNRFRLFRVIHNGGGCCGLFLKTNGHRLLYFGDTGNRTNYRRILESFNPTVMGLEITNGLGESTQRHLGWRQAQKVFDMAYDSEEVVKLGLHIRHDRERIEEIAEAAGIIVPRDGQLIRLGG